jgi:hypoxanthine phosphoribosyltransferase
MQHATCHMLHVRNRGRLARPPRGSIAVVGREATACAPGTLHAPGAAYSPRQMRDPQIGEILVQPDDLKQRVRTLGEEVTAEYGDRDLLLVGVLKGAVFFLADLMRHIDIPCEVDFMAVSSYGSATDSSGVVRILKDLDTAIEGRHVLIVEDIVDSGLTLQYLFRNLGARNPASLEVCALLTKPERRKVQLPIRFVGFEIPDRFAIGYGLDFAERYRNLPYVAALVDAAA